LVELAIVQEIGSIENKQCFFNVDLHDNKIMGSINHAFEACHSHVQLKVLHFVKLSFWNNYSKLEGQQNSIWCKTLRLELLPTCKSFFPLYLYNTFLFFISKFFFTFEFLDNG